MKKEFEWTDELVREYGNFYRDFQGNPPSKLWGEDLFEYFKKSKLKKEEKPYVSDAKYNGHTYIFTLNMGTEQSKTITVERDRLAEILIAEDKNKLIIEGFSNTEKYYTEKEYIQGLEDAFKAATVSDTGLYFKYKNLSDYLNSKQKP